MKDRVYTEEMGQPPKDVDMGSLPTPKTRPKNTAGTKVPVKKAKGGSIDGIAKRGRTKCKTV